MNILVNQAVDTYIGLGSNMEHPARQVELAIAELKHLPETDFVSRSSLYASKPLKNKNINIIQDDFINAVVKITTSLKPYKLLRCLQELENQFGRIRSEIRWGPRILDLDLLIYGSRVLNTKELTLPHYAIADRDFVLVPLAEVEPELRIPMIGSVAKLKTQCSGNHLVKLNAFEL